MKKKQEEDYYNYYSEGKHVDDEWAGNDNKYVKLDEYVSKMPVKLTETQVVESQPKIKEKSTKDLQAKYDEILKREEEKDYESSDE